MDHRRVTRWASAIGVVALCVAALTGCTTARVGADVGTSGARFHLAQIGGGPNGSSDRTIATRHVTSAPSSGYDWTVAAVDPRSTRLRIFFTDGACTSADRLDVEETSTTVVIGLTASKPFHGACVAVGIARSITVALRAPLGGRALVEATTGTNDGLPTTADPTRLPAPRCSTADGSASDVPVGMPDAADRMAPTSVSTAFVCRTWWPRGSARTASTTVTDRARVAALVAALNAGATDVRPADAGEDARRPVPARSGGPPRLMGAGGWPP